MAYLNLKGDEWDRILWDIEAEYWSIRRGQLTHLEYVVELANALMNDADLIMNALGGEWDFRSEYTITGMKFKDLHWNLHPLTAPMLAVCRRELKDRDYEIAQSPGGPPFPFILS